MASAARELAYQGGSVYGSLAYDLDRAVSERELRQAARPVREEHAAAQVRTVTKTAVRTQQHVSVLSVLGFLAVAALSVLVLMRYVQLTELSADVVALETQMATLKTQNVALTAEYQQMYDLSTVKEQAEEAGMAKARDSQIYYVDLSKGDSAVVYQTAEPNVLTRLLTSLNHGIYTVVEYFD